MIGLTNNVLQNLADRKWSIAAIAIGAILTVSSVISDDLLVLSYLAVLICGTTIIWGAIWAVISEGDITADLLVSIAIVASILINEPVAAAEICVIMQIGSVLEETTVSRAERGMSRVADSLPTHALKVDGQNVTEIPLSDVRVGDVVRVVPGASIPADGIVRDGYSTIDVSFLTGEPVPGDVGVGDRVPGGAVNGFGHLDVEVERVPDESAIGRVSRLVRSVDPGSAEIVRAADRWARYMVVAALATFAATLVLTGDPHRAVTVLVVFCPCALILATPTAVVAAAGNLAKHGILVRGGSAVEAAACMDALLMDKTGTLTTGDVRCLRVVRFDEGIDGDRLVSAVASIESLSEHPLGKAIADLVQVHQPVEGFEYRPGLGVQGKVDGTEYIIGNRRFLEVSGCKMDSEVEGAISDEYRQGNMVVLIASAGRAVGIAVLSDTLKETSARAVGALRAMGVGVYLVTGDSKEAAVSVAGTVGTDDVVWECMPDDKLNVVDRMCRDHVVGMVGDGVNDAAALRRAHVGFAMGGKGSDIAVSSSDVVLLNDDPGSVVRCVGMCRTAMKVVHVGIAVSLALNIAATALAVTGSIGPMVGALVHNIGSVAVVTMSAMLYSHEPVETVNGSEPVHLRKRSPGDA
ncbi:MAG: cation-translocating P-type ATPase [Candidatus Methanomethylophilaceae archaeon]|nr:cation-translocating P-type ATPase [Candidatus Methanomethylophilaceae archaeon]